jgi:hypothetical protein
VSVRLESAPLLPIAVSFAIGILVAPWLTPAPLMVWVLAGGLLALAGVVPPPSGPSGHAATVRELRRSRSIAWQRSFLPADHISRLALPPTVSIEGRIVDEPVRADQDRTRLLLEVEAYYDGMDRRQAEGRVQLTIYGEAPSLGEGQRIRTEVRLHRPIGLRNPGAFDYPAHLRREGIFLVGNGRGDRVTPSRPIRLHGP